jgi:hypothetical protein
MSGLKSSSRGNEAPALGASPRQVRNSVKFGKVLVKFRRCFFENGKKW